MTWLVNAVGVWIVQGTMTKAQERHFWNDWLGFSLLGIIRGMLLCIVY